MIHQAQEEPNYCISSIPVTQVRKGATFILSHLFMNAGFMPSHPICLLEEAQADYTYIAVMQESRKRTKSIQKENSSEFLLQRKCAALGPF